MVRRPRVAPGGEFEPLAVGPEDHVFVLTGAGISAESGLKTFRDADGLWEEHRIEDVATPEAFERDPRLVWRFYSQRRLQQAAPNPAHTALARLEERIGERLFLCTQNVDWLHEAGGSRRVHHMHGQLDRTRCADCRRPPFEDRQAYSEVPRCDRCGGRLRPHIVWFGEVPFGLDLIEAALEVADLFVCVGSSGAVYPAAGLVSQLSRAPSSRTGRFARTVYVGLEAPANAVAFDEVRLGKAGEVLPGLFG